MQLKPSIPETPETPKMISGNPGKANSGNSGNSLDYRSPELPRNPDPLETPGLVRILLSESASQHLTESGEECFAIVARQSWPHDPKRWAIYLLPVALRVANDATAVLLGKARAVRSRKPSSKQTGGIQPADHDAPPRDGVKTSQHSAKHRVRLNLSVDAKKTKSAEI